MNKPSIDQFFARSLQGEYDNDEPWNAVHALRAMATREVFDKAAE